jgi:chromosome segregation ATPase
MASTPAGSRRMDFSAIDSVLADVTVRKGPSARLAKSAALPDRVLSFDEAPRRTVVPPKLPSHDMYASPMRNASPPRWSSTDLHAHLTHLTTSRAAPNTHLEGASMAIESLERRVLGAERKSAEVLEMSRSRGREVDSLRDAISALTATAASLRRQVDEASEVADVVGWRHRLAEFDERLRLPEQTLSTLSAQVESLLAEMPLIPEASLVRQWIDDRAAEVRAAVRDAAREAAEAVARDEALALRASVEEAVSKGNGVHSAAQATLQRTQRDFDALLATCRDTLSSSRHSMLLAQETLNERVVQAETVTGRARAAIDTAERLGESLLRARSAVKEREDEFSVELHSKTQMLERNTDEADALCRRIAHLCTELETARDDAKRQVREAEARARESEGLRVRAETEASAALARVATTTVALERREAVVSDLEESLREREGKFRSRVEAMEAEMRDKLERQTRAAADQAAEAQAQAEDAARRVTAVERRETEAAAQLERARAATDSALEAERRAEERAKAAEAAERRALQRAEEATAEARERSRLLDEREVSVAGKEAQSKARLTELRVEHEELTRSQALVDAREAALQGREDALNKHQLALDERERLLETKESEARAAISRLKAEHAQADTALSRTRTSLEECQERLEALQHKEVTTRERVEASKQELLSIHRDVEAATAALGDVHRGRDEALAAAQSAEHRARVAEERAEKAVAVAAARASSEVLQLRETLKLVKEKMEQVMARAERKAAEEQEQKRRRQAEVRRRKEVLWIERQRALQLMGETQRRLAELNEDDVIDEGGDVGLDASSPARSQRSAVSPVRHGFATSPVREHTQATGFE